MRRPTRPSSTATRGRGCRSSPRRTRSRSSAASADLGESGAAEVHQRYLLAANAFRPSGADVDFEYLVKDVRGKLAYTVAIERSEVLYAGQTERRPQVLRSTMIFRFEHGAWKIVHRHADDMIDLELPGSD